MVQGDLGAAERQGVIPASPLDALVAEVRDCRICVGRPTGAPLPHKPRPVLRVSQTARILIAGRAPGTKVHASGIPFTDRSGDRLREWLGVDSEDFYDLSNFAVLPMGFCFPGQDARSADLPPRRECAPAWRAKIMAAMPQVELVLAIGLYAQGWHMGARRGQSLTDRVREWRASYDAGSSPRVLPLPHPSWRNTGWLKRNPWFETDLLPFLKVEIRNRIGAR